MSINVAMVRVLNEPTIRKRAIRSGVMFMLLRGSLHVARLNLAGKKGLRGEDLGTLLPSCSSSHLSFFRDSVLALGNPWPA